MIDKDNNYGGGKEGFLFSNSKLLRLRVGNLCGQINLGEKEVYRFLKTKYKNFLTNRRPHFRADIRINPTESPFINLEQTQIVQKDGIFQIVDRHNPGRELGIIDLSQKYSQLTLPPTNWSKSGIRYFIKACFLIFYGVNNPFYLHACGVVQRDGWGYVFTGGSGSGKTTIGRMSRGLKVFSDERVGIKEKGENFYVCETPGRKGEVRSAPLRAIFFTKKAESITFRKLEPVLAIKGLLANLFWVAVGPELIQDLLNLLTRLVKKVPCFELGFSLTDPLWKNIKSLEYK